MSKTSTKNKKTVFRVQFKWDIDGKITEGIAEESSWYLMDQRGHFYTSGPFQPPSLCDEEHSEFTALILVNGEYLSVTEIEKRLKEAGK